MLLFLIGFRSNMEHDRLKVVALVRIGPSCKQAKTELLWRVKYGGGQKDGSIDIKVDLNSESSDTSMVNVLFNGSPYLY